MKTIYVVTAGCYSDYHIEGVFDDRALAEKFLAIIADEDKEIEEWELNGLQEEVANHPRLRPYFVRMKYDGSVVEAYHDELSRSSARSGEDGLDIRNNMFCNVFAENEEHAVKIANERRTQRIAEGLWEPSVN